MKKLLIPIASLLLALACTGPRDTVEERGRGPGKADGTGECTTSTCGGPGIGDCHCDSECVGYGDCCSNYEPVCVAAPPPVDGGVAETDAGSGGGVDAGGVDAGTGAPDAGTTMLVPEFGDDATREIQLIADSSLGLNEPRDLEFSNLVTDQLFIANRGDDSISIVHDFFSSTPTISKHSGPGAQHFCTSPSALAFGPTGLMATAHEEDQVTQPSTPWDFMGPTLHDTELPLFDAGHQSHIDMLHNSPNAVGIAHYEDRAFFVFDGLHESITLYDYQSDHGHGGADHGDGIIRRYVEGQVGYVPDVASHMEVAGGLVYVADTGNNRIAVLDPAIGSLGAPLSPNYDGVDMRQVVGGSLTTLIDGAAAGLTLPSGLAIDDGRIFVSDAASGEIVAFDMDGTELDRIDTGPAGIMGITLGPDGDLYFINGTEETLGHVAR